MAILFTLEDFATPQTHTDQAKRPEDLPGYEEGYTAALAAFAATQTSLAQDCVQAISDITFGFAEARFHVMAGLEPLFRALIDKMLPTVLPDSFRAQVVAHLIAAARTDISHPFILALHPQQTAAVRHILPDSLSALLTLTADPGLSRNAAAIRQGDLETALDHDALTADICQALSALFDHLTESKSYG